MQPVDKFVIDGRSGDDDLSAPGPDAFDLLALRYREVRQALEYTAYLRARDHHALAAGTGSQMARDLRKGSGRSGGGNDGSYFCVSDAIDDLVYFPGHETAQPL